MSLLYDTLPELPVPPASMLKAATEARDAARHHANNMRKARDAARRERDAAKADLARERRTQEERRDATIAALKRRVAELESSVDVQRQAVVAANDAAANQHRATIAALAARLDRCRSGPVDIDAVIADVLARLEGPR